MQYTAPTFREAEKVHFYYRLDGYDSTWVDAGERRTAFYTNVPPGDYRFRVIACDAFGNWNRSGATLRISIRPHFYQTLWFRILCVALIVGATVAIVLLRIRRLQLLNQFLESKVRERTIELECANRDLQDMQAELEAQNEELTESRKLLVAQNEQLESLATTDGLTGLKNHRSFQETLEQELRSSNRHITHCRLSCSTWTSLNRSTTTTDTQPATAS